MCLSSYLTLKLIIKPLAPEAVVFVQVHPSKKYIAVAEKGSAPNINVYEFPSLKLYRILRGGTEKAYAFLDFKLEYSNNLLLKPLI